ncbi:hypothetical protein D3C86_1934260 [compost metagenome]
MIDLQVLGDHGRHAQHVDGGVGVADLPPGRPRHRRVDDQLLDEVGLGVDGLELDRPRGVDGLLGQGGGRGKHQAQHRQGGGQTELHHYLCVSSRGGIDLG